MQFLLLLLTILVAPAFASPNTVDREMNGYTLAQFGNFEKDWRLVTVRYRKDTGELRFVYANEAAWNTLEAGKTNYADGAAFAKIGMMSVPDPAFPSSVAPHGARRVQFMVRDQAKHVTSDGWGYALFDSEGRVFPGDKKNATDACVACHRIVDDRGQVFSQIMKVGVGVAHEASQPLPWLKRVMFETRNRDKIIPNVKHLLAKSIDNVRLVKGPLTEAAFFGTVDEVQPLLAEESLRSGLPTALIAKNGKEFSLVLIDESRTNCNAAKGEKPMRGFHSLPKAKKVYENSFCHSPSL